MNTITFFNPDGKILEEFTLDKVSIKKCHGMKIKCTLTNGTTFEGFANTFETSYQQQQCDYITLETYVNLDEETHTFIGDIEHKFDINRETVPISLISHIDAILYSGLRWGGIPTNKFNLNTNL